MVLHINTKVKLAAINTIHGIDFSVYILKHLKYIV